MGNAPPCFLSNAAPGRTTDGGLCRWREIRLDVISYCATRAPSANPAGGGVLRCAPAGTRKATALARLGPARHATVARAQAPPGSFLAGLR